MEYNSLNARINKKKAELKEVNEILDKLKDDFNNDYLDLKRKRDVDKYKREYKEIKIALNNLMIDKIKYDNDLLINESKELVEGKERFNEDFEKLEIDKKYINVLNNVILSKYAKVKYYKDENTIVIEDNDMLINTLKYDNEWDIDEDYNDGKLFVSVNDLRNMLGNYNYIIKFDWSVSNHNYFVKWGRLYIKTRAIIVMNNIDDFNIKEKIYNKFIGKQV